MANTAVLYCRISKDDQGDHLGVDRQERLCRDLAEQRELHVLDVLVDNDVSAYKRKRRPEFERLVDMLKGGEAGAVVCYHADRLYRRATDLERLVQVVEGTGAQVHTVAAGDVDLGTASGRMVARMLGAAAQHESERTGERIKVKHDELAAKGRPPGGRAPYGYSRRQRIDESGRVRNDYVVNAEEAAIVRRMADRVLEGASLLSIARELTAEGVSTREGRPWHHATVRSVLVNPAVAGMRVHRRKSRRAEHVLDSIAGPGDWEPVLDRATWEQVRAVIADPARKHKRPARRYLLTGMIETSSGDPMVGRPDRDSAGELTRRTYSTHSPSTVSMSIGADQLEEAVIEAVLRTLDEAALPVPTAPRVGPDVEAIEAELAELAELRGKGEISLAEWMTARKPAQARLDDARKAAATTRRPTSLSKLLTKPGAVRKAWPGLDFAEKREIIGAVVERIVVGPATRGRWTTAAERLLRKNGGRIVWRDRSARRR